MGIGAVAAAAVAGCRDTRQRQTGSTSSPVPSSPATAGAPATTGRPRTFSGELHSAHVPDPAAWTISAPAGELAGYVYCLHGFGEDHRFPFDTLELPTVSSTAGANVVIAAVDGGHDSYWHRRADGSDAQAMLLDEFIPLVEQQVPARTQNRALLGWSMGGYGALLAAETAPTRFRAVVAVSPALWTSAGQTA